MTDLFRPISEQEAVQHDELDAAVREAVCECVQPDAQYLLEIDNGSVFLIHKACGKQPSGNYMDPVEMSPIPVIVTAEPYGNCDGSQWHGEYRCDCGIALVATPILRSVPGRLPYTRKARPSSREAS